MKQHIPITGFAVALFAPLARAWHFDCRFIERVGNTNVVLPNNTIDASNGNARNIRIQFGVFDDAGGPAPAGGLVGWHNGALAVSASEHNSNERRNNGRIAPFNFVQSTNGNPPPPTGFPVVPDNPFTALTDIDARYVLQSPYWNCGADGTIPPAPPPTILGLQRFVSVFAFSIDPRPGAVDYVVTASGDLTGAMQWNILGTPTPPRCGTDCHPVEDCPGSIYYVAYPADTRPFSSELIVVVPSPATAVPLLLASIVVIRRR